MSSLLQIVVTMTFQKGLLLRGNSSASSRRENAENNHNKIRSSVESISSEQTELLFLCTIHFQLSVLHFKKKANDEKNSELPV